MKNLHREDSLIREHYLSNKKINSNLSPNLIYCGILKKNDNWTDDIHSHNFCEVLFIKDGEGTVEIDKVLYNVKKGDIVIYNSKTLHKEVSTKNFSFETLFFACKNLNLKFLPKNFLINEQACPIISCKENLDKIEHLFVDLINNCSKRDNFYLDIASSILKTIILYILKLTNYTEGDLIKKNYTFDKIKSFINENYDKQLSLTDICEELYISKFYLVHLFQSLEGISPKQYIIFKKIEKAKELLATNLSLLDISEQLGYSDVSYFSKAFKTITKMNPSHYREQLQNLPLKISNRQ